MNDYTCPRCGSGLSEEVWERDRETADGGFIIDVHDISVCPDEECG
jgi:hypothetical protein